VGEVYKNIKNLKIKRVVNPIQTFFDTKIKCHIDTLDQRILGALFTLRY